MAWSSLTGLESDPRPSLRYRDPGWMMIVLAVRISDRGSPDIMSSANIHLDTLKTNGLYDLLAVQHRMYSRLFTGRLLCILFEGYCWWICKFLAANFYSPFIDGRKSPPKSDNTAENSAHHDRKSVQLGVRYIPTTDSCHGFLKCMKWYRSNEGSNVLYLGSEI